MLAVKAQHTKPKRGRTHGHLTNGPNTHNRQSRAQLESPRQVGRPHSSERAMLATRQDSHKAQYLPPALMPSLAACIQGAEQPGQLLPQREGCSPLPPRRRASLHRGDSSSRVVAQQCPPSRERARFCWLGLRSRRSTTTFARKLCWSSASTLVLPARGRARRRPRVLHRLRQDQEAHQGVQQVPRGQVLCSAAVSASGACGR
jgi:hypothetical protein